MVMPVPRKSATRRSSRVSFLDFHALFCFRNKIKLVNSEFEKYGTVRAGEEFLNEGKNVQPARKDVDAKKVYERPVLRRLSLQQAKTVLSSQIKNILKTIRLDRSESEMLKVGNKRNYQKPTLKKLTSEQAKLLLIGHFSIGTEGANDLLDVIFPDPGHSQPGQKSSEQALL
jgi:hypothetical protein